MIVCLHNRNICIRRHLSRGCRDHGRNRDIRRRTVAFRWSSS